MAYNPYIVVPLAAWAIAQIGKFAIAALRGRVDFRYLYASGGMPSVHSAVVCSLATTALLVDGASSHLFGFTAIFAAIVMYDSFGVRRSSGEQAVAINMLVESLDRNRVKLTQPHPHLREILGHQPREVTAGALLGIGLAGLFNYDRLGSLSAFLQAWPARSEIFIYGGAFLVLLVLGVMVRFILRWRYPQSKTMRHLAKRILLFSQTIGWVGLMSAVLVYERASYLAWRLWPLLISVAALVWAVSIVSSSYKSVPVAMAGELNQARKLKWLTWGRDKSRKKAKRG